MSEPKWTRGPWRNNKYGSIGAGPLGHTPIVAIIEEFYGEDRSDGDSSANANLIASAPELYEALDAVVKDIQDYERVNDLYPNPGKTECWQSVTNALAVMRRACGETS
jgi:hypothetical protein